MVCFADFGGFDCCCNFSKLVGLSLEPIRGPDAMYDPAMIFKHCLTESVTIPSRPGTVIRRTIAFDAQNKSAGRLPVPNTEVNEEPGFPHLGYNFITKAFNRTPNGFLKRRIFLSARNSGNRKLAGFRIGHLESPRTESAGP